MYELSSECTQVRVDVDYQQGAVQTLATSGQVRLIGPKSCDGYDPVDEQLFSEAMRAYKVSSGRMFPTWSEVLEILLGLGYEKASDQRAVR